MATLTLPGRFNGPPTSANGGYAAGRLAAFVPGDGAVSVRLSSPPRLDGELEVRVTADVAELLDEHAVVARAAPATLDPAVPRLVTLQEAAAAQAARARPDHPFPTCFGCGPGRPDGESVAALLGPVPGDASVWAGVWRPTDRLPHADGHVADEVVWVALDCPGAQPVAPDDGPPHVLGTLTAALYAPVALDADHVLLAWPVGEREGRRVRSSTAVLRGDGTVCARADAIWFAVDR